MRYFKKEILNQNIVRDRHGKAIQWEIINGNTGLIALEETTNAELIQDLHGTIGSRGIVELSADGYSDVKKNRQQHKPPQKLSSFGGPVRVLRNDLTPKKAVVTPAGSDEPSSQSNENPVQAETKLAGGDQNLADAVVPAKPTPRLGRPRKIQYAQPNEADLVPA